MAVCGNPQPKVALNISTSTLGFGKKKYQYTREINSVNNLYRKLKNIYNICIYIYTYKLIKTNKNVLTLIKHHCFRTTPYVILMFLCVLSIRKVRPCLSVRPSVSLWELVWNFFELVGIFSDMFNRAFKMHWKGLHKQFKRHLKRL